MIPKPSIKYLPRLFVDNSPALASKFAAKIDSFMDDIIADAIGLQNIDSPERMPSQFLLPFGFYLNAGINQSDSDAVKRQKIYEAINSHKIAGQWEADVKERIDRIAGYDSAFINKMAALLISNIWVECDGVNSSVTRWTPEGSGDDATYPGVKECCPGGEVEFEVRGCIYINCHPSSTVFSPYLFLSFDDEDVLERDDSANSRSCTGYSLTSDGRGGCYFNGTSSRINCGDIADNPVGYTFCWRMKVDTPTAYGRIWERRLDGTHYIIVYLQASDGDVKFTFYNGTPAYVDLGSGNVCDGVWRNYALRIIDSTHVELLVNGVSRGIKIVTVPIASLVGASFGIGSIPAGGSYFRGYLDEFTIFDSLLTDDDVNAWNMKTPILTDAQVDAIVDELKDRVVPAYYIIYLSYRNTMAKIRTYFGGIIS